MPPCRDNRGTWTDNACPRAGIVGGCRADITGVHGMYTQTIWFYPGGSVTKAGDVMAKCNGLAASSSRRSERARPRAGGSPDSPQASAASHSV